MEMEYSVGFIGAGNMANAIANGILSKGMYKPSDIIVSARSKASLDDWEKKGITTTLQNCEVVSKSRIIFIAIKPQQFATMASSLHVSKHFKAYQFVSVMAGININKIKKALSAGLGKVQVIRVMPNLPFLVGCGCSVMCHDDDVDVHFEEDLMDIMTCGGTCDIVSEPQMHAVTAVSGSGPAYIYIAIEALADGGVKCGLPRELALKLASQTVMGAGHMVLKTGEHPGVLKDKVCSPGGTTIHAVHALESAGARTAFINAVEAAYLQSSSFK